MRGQDCHRGRALQGQQGAVIEALDLTFAFERIAQIGFIGVLAGRVDDERKAIAEVGDHQIVANAALLVGEERVALPSRRETGHVRRDHRLQRGGSIRQAPAARPQDELPHVRDIEEARRAAHVQMLLENPERVLNRHVVAGERHHARALRSVQRMQRGPLQVHDAHARLPSSRWAL